MASTPFQIPGNIKQQFLPFVLNPEAQLNKSVTSSSGLTTNCDPQVFSFRTNVPYMWSGSAKLNICPSSFEHFMSKDISNQLLYTKDYSGKSITFADVYNSLPTISIREFLPDTRLDQALNLFGNFMGKIMEIINNENKAKTTTSTTNSDAAKKKDASIGDTIKNLIGSAADLGGDIKNTLMHAWNFITGTTQPTNLFFKGGKSRFTGAFESDMYNTNSFVATYVMSLPWLMYYKLQSSVTSNIYEVPCKLSNNMVISSNGQAGWTGGANLDIHGSDTGSGKSGGIISKVLSFLGTLSGLDATFKNIRVNFMPFWDSKSGSGSESAHPTLEITFDLYNDTNEAAYANFIFVNTIAPNNRWIQYNMFQHSSALYDVKIEGLNRLYACKGKFDITYNGVLRDPPDEWIKYLVSRYGNKNVLKSGIDTFLIKNKIIKIPDIYSVKMTFDSLLPNNFNNYIFTYSQNISHLETHYDHVYDNSYFDKVTIEPIRDFWNEMREYVKTGGYNSPDKANADGFVDSVIK